LADLVIVDDDLDMGALLAEVLGAAGHTCRVAHNGREGLALVTQRVPDLVLLDVEMPVLSGPEMAYILFVRNCGDEKIPVILLSGMVGLARVAATVGTPYYLAKPSSFQEVQRLVDRALAERIPPRPGKEP